MSSLYADIKVKETMRKEIRKAVGIGRMLYSSHRPSDTNFRQFMRKELPEYNKDMLNLIKVENWMTLFSKIVYLIQEAAAVGCVTLPILTFRITDDRNFDTVSAKIKKQCDASHLKGPAKEVFEICEGAFLKPELKYDSNNGIIQIVITWRDFGKKGKQGGKHG